MGKSDIIDTTAALSLMGGNHEFYRELLLVFRENEADTVQRIRAAFSNNDSSLGHRLAHTLKSSAGAIGAVRLEKTALAVELAHRNGTLPGERLLDELESAHAEVMKSLDAFIARS